METLMRSFLIAVPQAAAIWLAMLAAAVVAGAFLSLPGRQRGEFGSDPSRLESADEYEPPSREERAWACRYAEEVLVAAERAAVTARRRRAEWELAHAALDNAWTAFNAADQAARRSASAAAFPVSHARLTPAEFADRERYLHRAATAACRRKELTVAELNEVLAHRNGWNPRLHPACQEQALHRAVRERRLTAYLRASSQERQAWRTAEVATAALRSLREEACAAKLMAGQRRRTAGQLWWAEQWTATEPVRHPATPVTGQLISY